ncbi:hypothetical protein [Paenibacillus periandrae]|uniref:hypothetical protein n=1 Tax=Paenibacillus periandrae TaxID=1761741 RepID=UPI001F091A13|nr:hypothetical protein [Paenibacillus periandrae]
MIRSYLDLRVCIPINESSEHPLNAKMDKIIDEMLQHLVPYNGTIEDHKVFTKEIVYTTSRGEDFTHEDILAPIMSWMSITEPFASFAGQLYELAREEIYNMVIGSLEGRHPRQAMDFFSSDERMVVIERMNTRIERFMGITVRNDG